MASRRSSNSHGTISTRALKLHYGAGPKLVVTHCSQHQMCTGNVGETKSRLFWKVLPNQLCIIVTGRFHFLGCQVETEVVSWQKCYRKCKVHVTVNISDNFLLFMGTGLSRMIRILAVVQNCGSITMSIPIIIHF